MVTIQNVVVLGGHGFIGRHVTGLLRQDGCEVRPLSRRDGFDLRDPAAADALFAADPPDAVFHLAANTGSLHYVTEHIADVTHDNVQMALNLYAAVAKHCPGAIVVNALANCSYPGGTDRYVESHWCQGEVHESVYGYGNAQRIIYVLARGYRMQHGIRSANFLVPNTYGPGDSTDPNRTHALNGMMIRMLEAKEQGRPEFEIWGTGRPVREWAWVGDVARVLVMGLTRSEDLSEPVNIGQQRGYSIAESAAMIAEAVGYEGRLVTNPAYADGAPEKIMDAERFRRIFPDFVFHDHRAGIRETIDYYVAAREKTE